MPSEGLTKKSVVYFHINPVKNEVFYVGMGSSTRPYIKRKRSKAWNNIVNKYKGYIVDVVETNLTKDEAIAKEIFYIKFIGRRDLGKGTLVNHTDGGEGSNGHKLSIETRAKMSEAKRNVSVETRAKYSKAGSGRPRPMKDETKAKISKTTKGRKLSDETKAKISKANKGRKLSKVTYGRIPWNKGIILTDEQKEQIALQRAINKKNKQLQ